MTGARVGGVAGSVRIDRLSLSAGPMSPADGRRLAELVGLALGRLPSLPERESGQVVVQMPATTGQSLEQIAEAVAAAIEAALRVEGAS